MMEAINMIISRLLTEKKVSATAAAKELGLSVDNMQNWASGRAKPKHKDMQSLAAYFEVTVDYLLGIENKPYPDREAGGMLAKEPEMLYGQRVLDAELAKCHELVEVYKQLARSREREIELQAEVILVLKGVAVAAK